MPFIQGRLPPFVWRGANIFAPSAAPLFQKMRRTPSRPRFSCINRTINYYLSSQSGSDFRYVWRPAATVLADWLLCGSRGQKGLALPTNRPPADCGQSKNPESGRRMDGHSWASVAGFGESCALHPAPDTKRSVPLARHGTSYVLCPASIAPHSSHRYPALHTLHRYPASQHTLHRHPASRVLHTLHQHPASCIRCTGIQPCIGQRTDSQSFMQ